MIKVILFIFLLMGGYSTSSTQENISVDIAPIFGTVQNIEFGKDGYTATVQSSNMTYNITVSRANLDDPTQYKELKKGDEVRFMGESWGDQGQNITVRVLE